MIPFFRQLIVACATYLAAISSGAVISFPNLLFEQLKQNDSPIHLDIHTTSWIGSVRVLAGICASILPIIMQSKGRKFTFILCCMIGAIGWIIVYFSNTAIALIIAEVFHGVSGSSLFTCSLITLSEMVHPRYRILAMNLYTINQVVGLSLMGLIGRYFYWKTVSVIACLPIVLAIIIGFAWPESPAWLAYKGDYDKCKKAFIYLRGTDTDAYRELEQMIHAQTENNNLKKTNPFQLNKTFFRSIRRSVLFQRDFYLPCVHMFTLICFIYWSGLTAILIYSVNILRQVSGSDSASSVGVNIMYSICYFNVIGLVFEKHFKNKTIIIPAGFGIIFFMLSASVTSYLQEIKVLSAHSYLCLYWLVGYFISFNLGGCTTALSLAAELMPVKHRGLGGTAFIFFICILDFSALKATPYLLVSLKPWGTFLLYTINAVVCMFCIWRYIPETKNRTLQEIENAYNNGGLTKVSTDDNNVMDVMNVDN